MIAGRGDDSNPLRAALAGRGIEACIPSKKNRKQPIACDKALLRQRQRIEIAFGRLKDWRRIAMRYDRCARILFGAITLAAIVTVWIGEGGLGLEPHAGAGEIGGSVQQHAVAFGP